MLFAQQVHCIFLCLADEITDLYSLYYHLTLFFLFRPFVRLSIISSDVLPQDVCTQASKAISAIVKSYSNLYTLRRTPSFVPTMFHLAVMRYDVTTAYSKGMLLQNVRDLKDMSALAWRRCSGAENCAFSGIYVES